ncbi:MAG TPA: nicotinate phosphoribosyltransferase [Euzebyales bacterium]|nr:nicotinate phosphoribosyltransferase [Euzebyales bacterium]
MTRALFTDFYELTMMAGYVEAGIADATATFDLFFRHPPGGIDQVVLAGVEQALDDLSDLRFTDTDIAYLAGLEHFPRSFLDRLPGQRFTCDVLAIREGTPIFGNEPLVRVTGPLLEGQWVETLLINRVAYASLVASHALAVVTAARGKPVLEFGARRAHGPDGSLTATRSAMIGGCAGTSNVEAARQFDLQVSGTQAHSWIMAFPSELDAFRAYAETFPDSCVLLVDTYDTLAQGVPNAIVVAKELAARGHRLQGVRLDSGNLDALSRGARAQLDAAGFDDAQIVASGDLDAARIAALEDADAPIDAYGVGTEMVTARSDPTFSGVYKVAEVDARPTLKLSGSPAKTSNPGRKQVWRTGTGDVVGLEDEDHAGRPLLQPALRGGRRVRPAESVHDIARRCREQVAALGDDGHRREVRLSDRLASLRGDIIRQLRS